MKLSLPKKYNTAIFLCYIYCKFGINFFIIHRIFIFPIRHHYCQPWLNTIVTFNTPLDTRLIQLVSFRYFSTVEIFSRIFRTQCNKFWSKFSRTLWPQIQWEKFFLYFSSSLSLSRSLCLFLHILCNLYKWQATLWSALAHNTPSHLHTKYTLTPATPPLHSPHTAAELALVFPYFSPRRRRHRRRRFRIWQR